MSKTYASLYFHLIFSTKNRVPTIDGLWMKDLHSYLGGTTRGLGGVALAVGGVDDHVHMLVSLKTTHCVADHIREVKKASCRWALGHKRDFEWQEGYAAFTVSASGLPNARQYIENQEQHHRQIDSKQELLDLLREAGIEPDMRYFE